MTIGVNILLSCIAGYFLFAAFVPQLRVRWGISKGRSVTISSAGVERTKWSQRKSRMGAISCLGFAVFVGGFNFPFPIVSCVVGFILIATGAVLDWLREPPTFT